MKPVILITLYRRYDELLHNIEVIRQRSVEELGYIPPIIIIWSEPDLRHWHIVSRAKTFILPRAPDKDEIGQSISYHCSRDLNFGLRFVKKYFGDDYYAIAHCCDAAPNVGVFAAIHNHMQENDAFLVKLPNSVTSRDVWHTNFFAVSMNENYWPPLLRLNEPDILEKCWGRQLAAMNYHRCITVGNGNEKTFVHKHTNDDFSFYLKKCVNFTCNINCVTQGVSCPRFLLNTIQKAVKPALCWMVKSLRIWFRQLVIKMSILVITLYLFYAIEKTQIKKYE